MAAVCPARERKYECCETRQRMACPRACLWREPAALRRRHLHGPLPKHPTTPACRRSSRDSAGPLERSFCRQLLSLRAGTSVFRRAGPRNTRHRGACPHDTLEVLIRQTATHRPDVVRCRLCFGGENSFEQKLAGSASPMQIKNASKRLIRPGKELPFSRLPHKQAQIVKGLGRSCGL